MSEKNEAKSAAAKSKAHAKDGSLNKSEEIRKAAAALKAAGEKPRPVTIIAMLQKRGIEVSSPQVSMVLKRMGFRPRRRTKAGKAAAGPVSANAKSARGKASKISVEDLVAAKKAISRLGGLDRALAAIEALRQFET
jgi:transposase